MTFLNSTGLGKKLVLGTALWGWGVTRNDAYKMLDIFFEYGGEFVDTATNYPINKCKEDAGIAIKWLSDWKCLNKSSKFSLIVKIGSLDNIGSANIDLSRENIFSITDDLKDKFEDSLSCISIHWDNRGGHFDDFQLIDKTVDALTEIEESNISVGISGIRFPELYYKASPELSKKWIIQVKENFVTSLARTRYEEFFPFAKYLAYGINLGGVKIGSAENNSSIELRKISIPLSLVDILSDFMSSAHDFHPRPTTLNELALATSYAKKSLSGVIIGPRNISQLINTMNYWNRLKLESNNFIILDNLNKLKKN